MLESPPSVAPTVAEGSVSTMATTIRDVARAAGVSVRVVSRVLNGSAEVHPETRRRIQALIEAMGYTPDPLARSLATRRTNTIGVIFGFSARLAFSDPFVGGVSTAIAEVAEQYAYTVVFVAQSRNWDDRATQLRLVRERRVDGFILWASPHAAAVVEYLLGTGKPFVLMHDPPPGCYERGGVYISHNREEMLVPVAEHLLALGHRDVAYICGPLSREHDDPFTRRFAAAGAPLPPWRFADGEYTVESGYAAAQQILAHPPLPTAIFASNDLMAMGAIQALRERGLRVPADVSIVGMGEQSATLLYDPPLTSVRLHEHEQGQTAARALCQLLTGQTPGARHIVLPSELVVRASTAPPRSHAAAALSRAGPPERLAGGR